jgi:hypothetical protein
MSVQRRPKRNTHENAPDPDAFIAGAHQSDAAATTPSKPSTTPVALRLDADLLRRIDRAAARRGVSRTALVSYACAALLENE